MNKTTKRVIQKLIEHNKKHLPSKLSTSMYAQSKLRTEGKMSELSVEDKMTILYEIMDQLTDVPEEALPNVRLFDANKIQGKRHSSFHTKAFYVSPDQPNAGNYKNTIFIDQNLFYNDFAELLEDVPHELKHFQQTYDWFAKGMRYRKKHTKNQPLPKDFSLKTGSLHELHEFWEDQFGPVESPAEKEAYAFGRANFAKAFEIAEKMMKEMV